MKSDSSFLSYANYNKFFVLANLFCDPTIYSGHSFLSIVYKFRGQNFRNVQMHDFPPFPPCNTSIFKHIKGCYNLLEYAFQKEEKCIVQHIQ